MHRTRNLVGLLVLLSLPVVASAQDFGLKTNLLYDASTTPNVAVEFGLGRKWTTDIGFGLNPWEFSDQKKVRHWLLQPELRYWFCQRFSGWFLAAHLMGGEFNAGGVKFPFDIAHNLHHNRYEGWFVGGGVGAGYQWPISRHFSIGTELAVGYDYLKYRKYPCVECGRKKDDGHENYFGPTKIAFNVIYLINRSSNLRQADVLTAQDILPMQTQRTPVLGGKAAVVNPGLSIDGSNATLSMAVNLDGLQLSREQTVVLRPRLRSADGQHSVAFRPLVINSHRQHVLHTRGVQNKNYPGALEVERSGDKPLTATYLASVPAADWMNGTATLELGEDHCGCGDLLDDETTPLLTINDEPEPVVKPDPMDLIALNDVVPAPFKPTLNLHGSAFITFVVNRWEVKPDYMDNQRELRKITDTLDVMVKDPNISVRSIKIHGWASPESPYKHNEMLAQNRAQSLTEYVKRQYDLPANVFEKAEATPENWPGLREAVEGLSADVLPNRAQILSLIDDGSLEPDPKEARIKKLYPRDYQYLLKNVYPHLRRSDYDISFDVRKFTLEEAKEIYKTRPQHLSLRELFDVANTFPQGSAERNRALQQALIQNPDSTAAIVNVANIALREGDVLKAETLLQRAGDSAEAWQTRAVAAILRERYDEADAALDKAKAQGADVARNRQAVRLLREADEKIAQQQKKN